jgi:DNA-binding beta-propeller fold protein YncE
MSTHRATRFGITVLSAVALVASGASPVIAEPPLDGRTLTGVENPQGVVVHPDGTVMVTSFTGSAAVSVFDPGATTANPARNLTGPLAIPEGIAIRPATGEIYVAAVWSGKVFVFDPAGTTPKSEFPVIGATGLAFDTNGDLYVTSHNAGQVSVFGPGGTTPYRTFNTGAVTSGIVIDPLTRDVYVSTDTDGGQVQVYPSGSGTPNAAKTITGLQLPLGLARSPASGRLYVVSDTLNVVQVFEPGAKTPTPGAELTGLSAPVGVGVHPTTGEIYVTDEGTDTVRVFPGPTMSLAAIGPVSGPVTGGTAVTITGANLGAVTGVSFGGVAATNVVAVSPTMVTAVAPAHAAGKVDVSVSWGTRIAGLSQAFEFTAVAPGRATAVSGAPGKGQVTVSWTPPADTGGVPVASYSVTPTPAGPACATSATSCTIAGLTNGTKYRFVVRATNTAGLSSDSDASAEVAPYIPVTQKVKAKKASRKLPRKGFTTVVNWVKRPKYTSQYMKATCTAEGIDPTVQLCRIYSYKTGKIKVRTKGFRNVRVTITLQALTKANAPVQYGPSTTWTRTWRVR